MPASDPVLASVDLWPVSWAPSGWAICNGAILAITSNQALFSLIGTTYGGNGIQNFALPDLRGRVAVGADTARPNYNIGVAGGAETVTLNTGQLPAHTHPATMTPPSYSATGTVTPKAGTGKIVLDADPTNKYPGQTPAATPVYTTTGNAVMGSSPLNITVVVNPTGTGSVAIQSAGGGAPVSVLQPFLALNYIIALTGTYPMRD